MRHCRILFVEDSRADFLLIARSLAKEEPAFTFEHVATQAALAAALEGENAREKSWDLVLSDYHLPGFGGVDVLMAVKNTGWDVPVIIVSGELREDQAVNLMISGAKDFVRKDNLARLLPAIRRELREAELRAEKKAAELALCESQLRNQKMIAMLPQLVWTCSPDGHCDFLSPQWLQYTGIGFDSHLGPDWLGVALHCEDRDRALQHWLGALAGKHDYDIEYRLRRHDGEYRWFKARGTRVLDNQGVVLHWFGTCTDIQDQKLAEEQLRAAIQLAEFARVTAEKANATKSAFLANMSHEIRTPLGAIMGFCEILRENALSAEERDRYLQTVIRNTQGLTRIIDDILDLAKVEAGKLEVEEIEFSPLDLLNQVIELFKDKAVEKGIYLRLEIDQSVPAVILSDPTRLRQILINVVGNAIKFTTQGGIQIHMKATGVHGGRRHFSVATKDTGIGLTADQRERLFRPFMQADNSTNRIFGGTGLGLVLSKRLAVALGGDIEIDPNHESDGCTFIISFTGTEPRAAHGRQVSSPNGSNADQVKFASDVARLRLSDCKVLLAEDSIDNQFLIRRLLTKHGAQVEVANDGEEAIRKALNSDFDLVLMDIQMPRVDGYEATRALRKNGYLRPIIALTAHAMKEEREKTFAAGCDAHLTKPLDAPELISAVENFSKSFSDPGSDPSA